MPAFMKAIMTVRTQQPPGGKGGREGAAACGLDGRRHHPSSAPSRDLPVRYGRERGCCCSAAVAAPAIDDSQEREKVPASREPRDRAKTTDNPLLPPPSRPAPTPLGRALARDGPGAGQARGAARRGGDEPARPGSEVGEAGEERGRGEASQRGCRVHCNACARLGAIFAGESMEKQGLLPWCRCWC